jgi:hypothetical protein
MPSDSESVRVIIQHIGETSSARPVYRLVGYSDKHTYRPVDFNSLEQLLQLVKQAIPEFDVSKLQKEGTSSSSILFAAVLELSEAQKSQLGFRT